MDKQFLHNIQYTKYDHNDFLNLLEITSSKMVNSTSISKHRDTLMLTYLVAFQNQHTILSVLADP